MSILFTVSNYRVLANLGGKYAARMLVADSMVKEFLSVHLGKIYHPFLHRLRHKSEYAPLKPILRNSIATMRRLRVNLPDFVEPGSVTGRTAIQIHIFYTDLLGEFYDHLKGISVPYDLYISTDTEEKKKEIESFFYINALSAGNVCVKVFENRGRDVYPFLAQLHDRISAYEYLAHFHTKKSVNSDFGDFWRRSLLCSLLDGGERFDRIVQFLVKNCSYGLIIPEIPKMSSLKWGYAATKADLWNEREVKGELSNFGMSVDGFKLADYEHPAGTMFVARTKAVRQVFEKLAAPESFPEESGQQNHTRQHALELVWHPVCEKNGYKIAVV